MLGKDIYIIAPSKNISNRLKNMISRATKDISAHIIDDSTVIPELKNKRIIFALEIDEIGFDIAMLELFSILLKRGKDSLKGSVAGVLTSSSTELGTKRASQDIIFLGNALGCSFIGKPLVEAPNNLRNFLTWQKVLNLSLEDICLKLSEDLGKRLLDYNEILIENPNITVLYSRPNATSNTLDLWNMSKKHLKNCIITEIEIENGEIEDCKGCFYKTCVHFGKQNSCFYGGIMTKDVLPSIEKADAIIWLCPNYNDALGANLTAAINRLTVLYHKIKFHNKNLFAVIVSGNSGSDSVAKQLIGALNINKGFRLPPYAFLMATANDPKAIFNISDIEYNSKIFAENLINEIKTSTKL